MPRADFDYQAYLASRDWSLLREQVRARSGNRCEHCFSAPQQAVHHLTYERIGREELADLMAICDACHAFFSGKSNENPRENWGVFSPAFAWLAGGPRHLLIAFNERSIRDVACRGAGCLYCSEADRFFAVFVTQSSRLQV